MNPLTHCPICQKELILASTTKLITRCPTNHMEQSIILQANDYTTEETQYIRLEFHFDKYTVLFYSDTNTVHVFINNLSRQIADFLLTELNIPNLLTNENIQKLQEKLEIYLTFR